MKILQVITELRTGGAEKVLATIIDGLHKEHEFTVAAFDARGEYAQIIASYGVEVIDLRGYSKFCVSALWRLRKLLKDGNFDLVHTHLYHANIATRVAAIGLNSQIIATCHIVERRFRPWHFIAERLTASLCKYEICVSEAVKNFQIQKTGLPETFFKVIYNGIDTEKFVPLFDKYKARQKYGLAPIGIIVGFLGRFDYQKGADVFIKALGDDSLENENFSAVVGGYGVEELNLRAIAEGLPAKRRPSFTGYLDNPHKFLQMLDICVIPSRWEGFGLVAVEAMACGCAVIASEVDSLSEIIEDEKNGLLFQSEDTFQLARKIKMLINEKFKRESLSRAGVEHAAKFSERKMIEEYFELYSALQSK